MSDTDELPEWAMEMADRVVIEFHSASVTHKDLRKLFARALVKAAERGNRTELYHDVPPPKSIDPNSITVWLMHNTNSSLGSMACALANVIVEAKRLGREEMREEATVVAETHRRLEWRLSARRHRKD